MPAFFVLFVDAFVSKRWRRGAFLEVSRRWRRSGMHRLLHAIEQAQRQGHRRVGGVGKRGMGRRAADRARSSRRRRGAGGRCPRPFLLRFVAFLRAKLHRLERRLASLQSCLQCSQPAGNCSSYLLRVTAVLCVRTAAHTDLAIVAVGGAHERPRKEPHRQWYDSNATCYAKQQHSTTPEGRYPSQRVAGQTERYSGLASEEL